jgi:YD repeat-containing protein
MTPSFPRSGASTRPGALQGSTGSAETYAYDAAGNMTQAKNPTATFNLEYDDDGRRCGR